MINFEMLPRRKDRLHFGKCIKNKESTKQAPNPVRVFRLTADLVEPATNKQNDRLVAEWSNSIWKTQRKKRERMRICVCVCEWEKERQRVRDRVREKERKITRKKITIYLYALFALVSVCAVVIAVLWLYVKWFYTFATLRSVCI